MFYLFTGVKTGVYTAFLNSQFIDGDENIVGGKRTVFVYTTRLGNGQVVFRTSWSHDDPHLQAVLEAVGERLRATDYREITQEKADQV